TFMVAVDEFVVDRTRIGQNAQPTERINALINADHLLWDGLAADAVEAIASTNEVTDDLMRFAAFVVAQSSLVAQEAVQANVFRFEDDVATRNPLSNHEILLNFCLPIDANADASYPLKIDAMTSAVEGDLNAVVGKPLALKPRTDSRLRE